VHLITESKHIAGALIAVAASRFVPLCLTRSQVIR